ncbi:electron transport complex subunit RsxD [Bowmanella yangjiangensis]|uniref:Ion-translocating oxidoreductase complex subunit D n=1 Tax=Bowmanella yangjiangensis TaxID=2811230 RepID=A0ABS3CUZ3_9ALTE|nr:electron transport complex subunit RsxD [Bowmanella yangjiangensis]MBN7820942.1 electron transport complex subunit RsxD [Bowmanella yangjiangensis]
MSLRLASSPHQHQQRSTAQLMRLVCYCALPGFALQCWFFGWGSLIQFAIAAVFALGIEAAILEIRKKDFERALADGSALLTALLLAICIPPLTPWWITAIGAFFAIGISKQLYGGLGFNLFNPAMVAYVTLLVSFPVAMTSWMPPVALAEQGYDFFDALRVIFTGFTADGYSLSQLRMGADGFTMATPLDSVKTDIGLGLTLQEATSKVQFADGFGIGWLWINLAYLTGGLLLLKLRAIKWQIPVSMLGAILLVGGVIHLASPDLFTSPWFHLLSGGTMLGAFFIATDPVSASTTDKGRLIFGAGIGVLVIVIRTWGGYPDAIAFAVVLMNMTVPLIDYYTRPRTYGYQSRGKKR